MYIDYSQILRIPF